MGPTLRLQTPNDFGVHRKPVLSPALFNLAAVELPFQLSKIPDPGFTIYTDDMMIWSKDGSHGHDVISAYTSRKPVSNLLRSKRRSSLLVAGVR